MSAPPAMAVAKSVDNLVHTVDNWGPKWITCPLIDLTAAVESLSRLRRCSTTAATSAWTGKSG